MINNQAGINEKHSERIHHGLDILPSLKYGIPGGLGNKRWTGELLLATYLQASTGQPPSNGLEYRIGDSGGGFAVASGETLGQYTLLQESIEGPGLRHGTERDSHHSSHGQ